MRTYPKTAHALEALRTAVSVVGLYDPDAHSTAPDATLQGGPPDGADPGHGGGLAPSPPGGSARGSPRRRADRREFSACARRQAAVGGGGAHHGYDLRPACRP